MTKTKSSDARRLALPPRHPVLDVARAAAAAGARLLVVGGWVRNRLLDLEHGDLDVELCGLCDREAEALLARHGPVLRCGRAFAVWRVRGIDAEFSASAAPFPEASRRRDLTCNSIGWDPLTGGLLDPHGGVRDLAGRRLRATDARRFGEDPLRGLRVARLAASLGLHPDAELEALCAGLDASGLAGERVFGELRRLLLEAERPSVGLELLRRTCQLRFHPEIEALVGVPQDPVWHPEGELFGHTLRVVDAAAALRTGRTEEDALVAFAAVAHDFGKPAVTVRRDGRVRSPGHDVVGQALAAAWLARLRAASSLQAAAAALVRHHLAPSLLVRGDASPRAFRRLARKLESGGTGLVVLERLARADHLGRTTPEAQAGRYAHGDRFLERVRALDLEAHAPAPVVRGRHLLARGLAPGPELGRLLARCQELQDRTGWTDPDRILDRVLHRDDRPPHDEER